MPTRRQFVAAVTGGIVTAVGAVVLDGSYQGSEWLYLQGGLLLVSSLLCLRAFVSIRATFQSDFRVPQVGSLLLAGGTLIAICVPGQQLFAGTRQSRLTELGFPIDNGVDVRFAYIIWALALVAFVVGETIGLRIRLKRTPPLKASVTRFFGAGSANRRLHSTATLLALLGLGAVGIVVSAALGQKELITSRGNVRGEGLLVILGYCLPLAACLSIIRFRRDRGHVTALCLSVGASAYLMVLTGSRTSLLLVLVALMLRVMGFLSARRIRVRHIVAGAVATYVLLILLVLVPVWRHSVATGGRFSLIDGAVTYAVDPLGSVASVGGLDTLDGLIFSTKIDPSAVGATWADPAKAVLDLVPYQLWNGKPEFLGPALTHRYLNFGGGAGIFLSGPGYAYIIFGGAAGVAVAFLLLGLASAWTFGQLKAISLASVLGCFFLIRFFFGGDAFNAFETIEMAAALGAAYLIGASISATRPRKVPAVVGPPSEGASKNLQDGFEWNEGIVAVGREI